MKFQPFPSVPLGRLSEIFLSDILQFGSPVPELSLHTPGIGTGLAREWLVSERERGSRREGNDYPNILRAASPLSLGIPPPKQSSLREILPATQANDLAADFLGCLCSLKALSIYHLILICWQDCVRVPFCEGFLRISREHGFIFLLSTD